METISDGQLSTPTVKKRQPAIWYIVAGVGYIPLVGIPFGIVAAIRGILTVNSHGFKLLVVSLFSFIPMTVLYSSLFYFSTQKGGVFSKLDDQLKEHILSQAVPSIEMQKVKSGEYPIDLSTLSKESNIGFLTDSNGVLRDGFYYEKKDSGYILGHSGTDALIGTSDDLVPILRDTLKLGIKNAVIGDIDQKANERFNIK